MKKYFSYAKYVADVRKLGDSPRNWARECVGREVKDRRCKGAKGITHYIEDAWCYEKFEVGDRVRAIKPIGNAAACGKVGTIVDIDKHGGCAVEFDEDIDGHNAFGVGKFGHCWWISPEGLEFVKAPQVIFDGEKTTLIKDGTEYVAKCNKGDTYDREKGLLVCLAKANGITYQDICAMLRNAETKEKPAESQKNGVKEVKRRAKVGEYIKIAGDSISSCGCYKSGDILKVYKSDFTGVYCDLKKKLDKERILNDSGNIIIFHHEYVVLEGYKPYKITLSEFWAQKGKNLIAIHCKTEEEAKKLLKAFDRVGQKWKGGGSYLYDTQWGGFEEATAYTNDNMKGAYNGCWVKNEGATIYNFNEIDLDN